MENKRNRPFTVIVEGNIGSGKTTFLEYFNRFNNVCVLTEPIELWRNCNGHNLLGHLYEDIQKWSFTFQSFVQLTMLQHHTFQTPHPIKLMERSIFSARHCFVEKMYKEGAISTAAYSVIDEYYKWINDKLKIPVDLIVYLRTTPEVVYERMIRRNRSEEKFVPLDYIKQLHEFHENWLYYKNINVTSAPIVIIDADLDKTSIVQEYQKCEPHILNKISVQA